MLKYFSGKTTERKSRQPSRPSPKRLAQETQHSQNHAAKRRTA